MLNTMKFLATVFVLTSVSFAYSQQNTASTGPQAIIDITYMDNSIRPQDDFFIFCNGSWVKNNPVPDTESRWGSFNELDQDNKVKLKLILDKASQANAEKGSASQLVGDYYTSFMDMEKRNKLGYSPIQNELAAIRKAKKSSDIQQLISKLHKEGVRPLFYFGVRQDLKNVNGHITYFSQGGLGLPNKTYYLKEDKAQLRAEYVKHITRMFELIGDDAKKASQKANSILELEKALAQASMSPDSLRVPENTYNKMSRSEFEAMAKNMDWASYYTSLNGIQFDSIVVGQPLFLSKINSLLKTVSIDDWKAYLTWNVVNRYASHLSEEFVQADFDFYSTTMSGTKTMKPLNERAINELTNLPIGQALGRLFVDSYYSTTAQDKINVLVDNLTIAFRERLETRSWMSDETKKRAIEKLDAISRKLGFPDEWEDFSALTISKDDYIANVRAISQYSKNKNLSKLNNNVDKKEWGMPPHMVNAYYHPLMNEIAFPAGIMQPPFFDEHAEDAVNYSRIGMVIGHELTHGFDDMGSKFAADGSFTNWWSDEDREHFNIRTSMLGATFEDFCPFQDQCVNPHLTMGENIADLGGVTVAFYAYKKTDEYKNGVVVDGFTPAQRFFIGFGQLWKINYKDEELKKRLATDPHSPGMYRINGPLKNCPEFFEAFNVQEGDAMRNPKGKVAEIW
jgi:putative endopeptidase